jgi:hypothetical protein
LLNALPGAYLSFDELQNDEAVWAIRGCLVLKTGLRASVAELTSD